MRLAAVLLIVGAWAASSDLRAQEAVAPVPARLPAATPESTAPQPQPVSAQADDAQRANQRLLNEKLSQLGALQAEVDRLRQEIGNVPQLLVKFQIVDVDVTRMRELGLDFKVPERVADREPHDREAWRHLLGLAPPDRGSALASSAVVKQDSGLFGFLDALRTEKIAAVLAAPNVIAQTGHSAHFQAGGEHPVPAAKGATAVEFLRFGTELDVNMIARANRRVLINVRARVSERDDTHAVSIEGAKIPGKRVFEISTVIESTLGDTTVFRAASRAAAMPVPEGVEKQAMSHEIVRLVLVTPEMIYTPLTAAAE